MVPVGEEGGEPIDAAAPAGGGRQPVLQGCAVRLVRQHRLRVLQASLHTSQHQLSSWVAAASFALVKRLSCSHCTVLIGSVIYALSIRSYLKEI
jgi:hypothetical protein